MNRARVIRAFAPLFFLAAFDAHRVEAWTGQLADQVISRDDGNSARNVRLLLQGGTLHAFWSEAVVSEEIHYGRSTDGGLTWSSALQDRPISHGNDPSGLWDPPAAAGRGGPLLVCWSEDAVSAQEILFGVSNDDGLTWSSEGADQLLSFGGSTEDAWAPSAAADGESFHVVWAQFSGPTREILYSRSLDGGQTWSGTSGDRVISFPDGHHASQPKIALGTDGRLYVVWIEGNADEPMTIHFGWSTDGGDTWSCSTADREISPALSEITSVALAAGLYDPCIHVVYAATEPMGPRHGEIFGTYSWDAGQNWTGEVAPVRVSCNEGGNRWAHNPDVYISRCGPITAVWDEIDEGSGVAEIHWSEFTDGAWSGAAGDQILSFAGGWSAYRPSIVGEQDAIPFRDDDTPDAWVAWSQPLISIGDNWEILLSRGQLCTVGAVEPAISNPGLRIAPNPSSTGVRMELSGSIAGPIEIIDASGRVVRLLGGETAPAEEPGAGQTSQLWDGRDGSGRLVPAGVYLVRAREAGGEKIRKLIRY